MGLVWSICILGSFLNSFVDTFSPRNAMEHSVPVLLSLISTRSQSFNSRCNFPFLFLILFLSPLSLSSICLCKIRLYYAGITTSVAPVENCLKMQWNILEKSGTCTASFHGDTSEDSTRFHQFCYSSPQFLITVIRSCI